MTKKNKSKKGKRKENGWIHSPAEAEKASSSVKQGYDGPIQIRKSLLQEDMMVTNAFFITNAQSSSGGILSYVATSDPTAGPVTDWSSLSAAWEEYRVLGVEMEFFPNDRYNRGTLAYTAPGVGVVDHAGSGALTSLISGFSHGSSRVLTLDDPWTNRRDFKGNSLPSLTAKMASSEEALFNPTSGSPATQYAIKVYFTGLSASQLYGLIYLRFLIQFRGRA